MHTGTSHKLPSPYQILCEIHNDPEWTALARRILSVKSSPSVLKMLHLCTESTLGPRTRTYRVTLSDDPDMRHFCHPLAFDAGRFFYIVLWQIAVCCGFFICTKAINMYLVVITAGSCRHMNSRYFNNHLCHAPQETNIEYIRKNVPQIITETKNNSI